MADQFNQSFLQPEFAPGEAPSAQKMNHSFLRVSIALEGLARAIGDIHDSSSVNSDLSDSPLRLLQLGRVVGPAGGVRALTSGTGEFSWSLILEKGRNSWTLPYWPYDSGGNLSLALSGGTSIFGSDIGTGKFSGTGQWKYDEETNTLLTSETLLSTNAMVTATSHGRAPIDHGRIPFYSDGGNFSWNLYPPLSETSVTCVSVQTSTSTAYDYIVSAGSLSSPRYQSPISSTDRQRLSTSEIAALPSAGGAALFPSVTSVHPGLPITSLSHGELIPSLNFALWDETGASLIKSGSFYFRDQTSVFYKGQPLSTAHSTAPYRLVTTLGYSHELILENLLWDMRHHQHQGPHALNHEDLLNSGYSADTSVIGSVWNSLGREEGWYRPTVPSYRGNPHPQYLSRNGYDAGLDDSNLRGMMLGDVRFAALFDGGLLFKGIASTDADAFATSAAAGKRTPGIEWGGTDYSLKVSTDSYSTLEAFGLDFLTLKAPRLTETHTDKKVSLVGSGTLTLGTSIRSAAQVVGENITVSKTGKVNTYYEVAGKGLTMLDGTALGSDGGKYGRYSKLMIDADERLITKPYPPSKWFAMENSTFREEYIDTAVRRFREPYAGVWADQANQMKNYGVYLEVPSDSVVRKISIAMDHHGADLRLIRWSLDGVHSTATTTSLPSSAGARTTYTWELGTDLKTKGSRFTGETADDFLLMVVNNSTSTSTDDYMVVRGAKAELSIGRF